MRSKRFRKYRRQFPVAFFLVKLVLIWYLVVFSISYLTSGTAAHFYDAEESDSMVYAGFWADGWDGSSLSFVENGNTNIKACDPVEITKEIQNSGDEDMLAGSTYDVYYAENGNPEKHGVKLDLSESEGNITALESGESTILKYLAQKPGRYAFLVQQPEGHPDKESIWSKSVKVNCPPGKTEQEAEEDTQESAELEEPAEPEVEGGENGNTESNADSSDDNEIEETKEENQENETGSSDDNEELSEKEEEETGEAGEES
ncbi:amyloid fiber anchoring/assembly protein TapA [Virgibacillus sp. YIM 98842]|uniref:amyloid fiber anchoring/assembly protein TapA n=1 Tax=Virgibacillus sp. YIM 98842 TaxID=2663533 RepID=UPI0013DC0326|nr:amyloid fiber anchoring/assembly protein TapA [Virgibacillus sp. YIM 98842]